MKNIRFVGLDVHAETIAVAVAEPKGKSDLWVRFPTAKSRSENWCASLLPWSSCAPATRPAPPDTSSIGNWLPLAYAATS